MNLDQIRAKLAGLNKKTNKRRDLWKPKDKHVIRCLPYPHGDEPIIELGWHYDIKDRGGVLCPKHNEGKDCAICDFAEKLRSWNDPETGVEKPEKLRKADFELFKKIAIKERWYIPVVERGFEDHGPKFYAFGKSIYEQLLKMCLDEEMNEDVNHEGGTKILTDPNCAYDLNVEFYKGNNEDGKGNKRSFPLTDIKEKKRPSKLAKTKKEADALIDAIPNINEVYEFETPEAVEKIFEQFVNSGGAATVDTEDAGKEYKPKKYKSNSAEKPVEGGQSIDEAFEDILAD